MLIRCDSVYNLASLSMGWLKFSQHVFNRFFNLFLEKIWKTKKIR